MSTNHGSQPILNGDEGTRGYFYDKTESLIGEATEACSQLTEPFDMSVRGRLTQARSILESTRELSVTATSREDLTKYNDLRSWAANALSLVNIFASNGAAEGTSPDVLERALKATTSVVGHVNVYSLLSTQTCEQCSRYVRVRQLVPSIYTCLEDLPSDLSDQMRSILQPLDDICLPEVRPLTGHDQDVQATINPLRNTLSEIMQSLEDVIGSELPAGCPQEVYSAAKLSVESCKMSLAAIEEAIQSQPSGEEHEGHWTVSISGFNAL